MCAEIGEDGPYGRAAIPNRKSVSVGLGRLRLRCLLSVRLAMLRGKEIPYHLDGRDNLLEALLDPRNQGTIAHHERQAEYNEPKPAQKPCEQKYRTYAEMPAFY
jgi:hypothetical protein